MGKNNFKNVVFKLVVRLIGLDICCFIASMFTVTLSNSQLVRALIQLSCIVAMISFVYPICHSLGNHDATLVKGGHKKHSPFKGLLVGIIASSPFIISAIILLIAKLFGVLSSFANYYKIINSFFFPYLFTLLPVDYSLAEMSYINILLSVLVVAVIPIICMFAYMLGFSRFYFSEKILYKKNSDNKQI